MKMIEFFGYQITIRKIRTRHPLDTQGYKREIDEKTRAATERLRREIIIKPNPHNNY